jgi:hypothetical protein
MLPTTSARVRLHTSAESNARIRRGTEQRLHYYAEHPEEIDTRLESIEREWDVERAMEAQFAGVTLFGFVMAVLGRRRWLVLSGLASGFMLQHALQGWCPPLALWRRVGLRTQSEIELERYALRALRGDFEGLTRDARDRGGVLRKLVAEASNGEKD